HRRRLAEPVIQDTDSHERHGHGRPLFRTVRRRPQDPRYALAKADLSRGSVNVGKAAIDIVPRSRRRWKVALEDVLAVADALADRILQLLQLLAALPARLQMRADRGSVAGR